MSYLKTSVLGKGGFASMAFFVFAVLLFFPLLVVMMVIVLVMDGRSRTDMRSTAVQQQSALQSKAQTKCEEKALAKPEHG